MRAALGRAMTAGPQPPGLDRNLSTAERADVLAGVLQVEAALQRLATFVNAESEWPEDVTADCSRDHR